MELTKSFVINCRSVRLLRDFLCQAIDQVDEKDKEIAELKAKLESVQATAYADSVDAGMENSRLKRALWMARHERACAVAQWHLTLSEYEEANKWDKVVQKTLAKAEAYK